MPALGRFSNAFKLHAILFRFIYLVSVTFICSRIYIVLHQFKLLWFFRAAWNASTY